MSRAATPESPNAWSAADRTDGSEGTTVRAQRTSDLFARAAAASNAAARKQALDEVIVLNMGLADAIASRYRRRGIADEDLRQVAYLALTRAAQRFDPARGTPFVSFAVPTMRGEVRKYFRDHGWMVRPPRRIQELQPVIGAAGEELRARLGRSPRPSEVAAHIGHPLEEVVEALSTEGCFSPRSLDQPTDGSVEPGTPIGELIGFPDAGHELVEMRAVLQPVIDTLSGRDRRILALRFLEGLTQREIAEDIGVTQMQVSRLLTRILKDLRTGVGELAQVAHVADHDRDLVGAT